MKKALVFIALASVALAGLFAQSAALSKTDKEPLADGMVLAGEYSWSQSLSGGAVLSASLGKDGTLFLALESPAKGWAGLGIGNTRMDGSRLFLGAEVSGVKSFAEFLSSGHSPSPAPDTALLAKAVAEKEGRTTLEISLPLARAASGTSLSLIYSWSGGDNFMMKHMARGSVAIPLK